MAERDSHVRPIRQKNGGLSAARTLNGSCENFVPMKKRLTKRTKNAIFFLSLQGKRVCVVFAIQRAGGC